ncbi:HNH endonuclease [Mycoplasmopsis gallinacea]|uniref:HNH domain-containing protein n=1 Tax=Mycoplasmopsis gallinacea TaxID=29556 RepID=A0A6H0V674_9BACT|nr:HNH endonuclease [Mycoplasmopsis gallinacea]QIW62005.1 hypothetical protein GOQ20_00785 [Mycoplasmopsis gallinacea]
MNIIKVSEFLKSKKITPFLFGSFLSRTIFSKNNQYIFTISTFKQSKKSTFTDDEFKEIAVEYRNKLNDLSGEYPYWTILENFKNNFDNSFVINNSNMSSVFVLENDLNLDLKTFEYDLFIKFISENKMYKDEEITNEKREFLTGFFELRGSVDEKLNFLSIDYFFSSVESGRKIQIIIDILNIPLNLINLNFRELQKQYINGKKRNTQLRINLLWYSSIVGFTNPYKINIIENVFNAKSIKKDNYSFFEFSNFKISKSKTINRLNSYLSDIYNRELNNKEIQNLREEYKFKIESDLLESKKVRSKFIRDIVYKNDENICVGCGDKYNLEDRTFMKKDGFLYLEVHHGISFKNGYEFDVIENLIKLCPICHLCLSKNKGRDEDQKEIIKKMIEKKERFLKFAIKIFNTNDQQQLIEKIHQKLG